MGLPRHNVIGDVNSVHFYEGWNHSTSVAPKEGLTGLVSAKPSFGMAMTKFLKPVLTWHDSIAGDDESESQALPASKHYS